MVRCLWAIGLLLAGGCGRTSLAALGTNGRAEGLDDTDNHGGAGGSSPMGSGRGGAGSVATGGAPGSGATRNCSGASCVYAYGLPCTSDRDCPSGSTCRDGSDQSGDGTRLPVGDDTNPGELVVSSDGLTVADTVTGLIWQRDGSLPKECVSDADVPSCTWAQAKAACASLVLDGMSGWRLPGTLEMFTIVDVSRQGPSIDQKAFPNTSGTLFWTSSRDASSAGDAWCVDFNHGTSNPSQQCSGVRCVRGSRCYPITRFVVQNPGLVRDRLTNLEWQQQTSKTKVSWWNADSSCPSGFRLPTLKELMSIVDLTVTSGPSINQQAFVNTPSEDFWTSSPSRILRWAWAVSFDRGWAHELPGDAQTAQAFSLESENWVRCVR